MKDRRKLETLLRALRKGDTLVVTKLDRLARSVFDLKERGAFLDMLGVFAEFELNLRRKRQAVGIEQGRLQGARDRQRTSGQPCVRVSHPEGGGLMGEGESCIFTYELPMLVLFDLWP